MNKQLTVIKVMSSCAQMACSNKANWQQQAFTVISHSYHSNVIIGAYNGLQRGNITSVLYHCMLLENDVHFYMI